jgi:hypothetical protein
LGKTVFLISRGTASVSTNFFPPVDQIKPKPFKLKKLDGLVGSVATSVLRWIHGNFGPKVDLWPY